MADVKRSLPRLGSRSLKDHGLETSSRISGSTPGVRVDSAPAGWSKQKGNSDSHAGEEALTEGRVGADDVTPDELREMGSMMACRHLMARLAKGSKDRPRGEVIREVAELLLRMEDVAHARRLLLQMAEAGRIVDIYPLEVMTYLVETHPGILSCVAMGSIVLNKPELEDRAFEVEEIIQIRAPLALRMRAFAIEEGKSPGYCFAPGPPGSYHLELAQAGVFTLQVRGEIRRKSLIDRVTLKVVDRPEGD